MDLFTIGFGRKTAEQLFGILRRERIEHLVDVRLNNTSQLAGFTKRDDLRFFLRELCQCDYSHEPLLAPTKEILDAYKGGGSWEDYEQAFGQLLIHRSVDSELTPASFRQRTVLLCSEPSADHCHRRLVAEYLAERWGGIRIAHLGKG